MEVVPCAQLQLGMFVADVDCPWTELPFLIQGLLLENQEQIDILQARCSFVTIDRRRSIGSQHADQERLDIAHHLLSTPLVDRTEAGKVLPRRPIALQLLPQLASSSTEGEALSHELLHMVPVYQSLQQNLQTALTAVSLDRDMDLPLIQANMEEVSLSVERNPDAVMWLARLKRQDDYSFDHALDVSVNLMVFARHLGWSGEKLTRLGLAGLLQDVGKIQLPEALLRKREKLDDEERELVRSHVASSLEMLVGQPRIDHEVLAIVSRHHERYDGSGYPQRMRHPRIGIQGEMAGLLDSYCAMTRDKPYRQGIDHQRALEELYGLRERAFSALMVEQFLQCVGLYPIATLVEMNSGEVGVVMEQNRVERARPRVLVLLGRDKQFLSLPKVIDLREESRNPLGEPYRIAHALPADSYNIRATDFYLD
jgi:HD-GYP domain-containing protein (c-di-GMP phosphodiesterase class II)